jgi:hypothetical protein
MKMMKKCRDLALAVILLAAIVSCGKDSDNGNVRDTEEYGISVHNDKNDQYASVISIYDYSKAQKLKWNISFMDPQDANYFTLYPTRGTGSGTSTVRIRNTSKIESIRCRVHIELETASGKQSEFNPYVDFQELQKLFHR